MENFDDHPSMERIMKDIIERLQILNVAWIEMHDGQSLEVVWSSKIVSWFICLILIILKITFSLESGEKCDDAIHMLSEWGIGQRDESSISIIPCTLYYNPNKTPGQNDEQQVANS